jgi:hypothetical protein
VHDRSQFVIRNSQFAIGNCRGFFASGGSKERVVIVRHEVEAEQKRKRKRSKTKTEKLS